jgi:hypothetical protein
MTFCSGKLDPANAGRLVGKIWSWGFPQQESLPYKVFPAYAGMTFR